MRSLLKFGPLSTRYKDIFDLCYLTEYVERDRLMECMSAYIFDDSDMRENDMNAIRNRVSRTFANRAYRRNMERSGRVNWLKMKASLAFDMIENFLETL